MFSNTWLLPILRRGNYYYRTFSVQLSCFMSRCCMLILSDFLFKLLVMDFNTFFRSNSPVNCLRATGTQKDRKWARFAGRPGLSLPKRRACRLCVASATFGATTTGTPTSPQCCCHLPSWPTTVRATALLFKRTLKRWKTSAKPLPRENWKWSWGMWPSWHKISEKTSLWWRPPKAVRFTIKKNFNFLNFF